MIVGAILVAEAAFWVFLVAGLTARYVLRRPRLGIVLLLGSPAADLALLGLTAVDLTRGATPTQAHALAALYLGFTVAFGHSAVSWADRHFAHRFAGGPPVVKVRRVGRQRVEHERREFAKAALGWAVSAGLLLLMTALVGDITRAQVLLSYAGIVTAVLVVWFVTGPLPAFVSAARESFPANPSTAEPVAVNQSADRPRQPVSQSSQRSSEEES